VFLLAWDVIVNIGVLGLYVRNLVRSCVGWWERGRLMECWWLGYFVGI